MPLYLNSSSSNASLTVQSEAGVKPELTATVKQRLLLVGDDPVVRLRLLDLFESEGNWEVHEVVVGQHGLKSAKEFGPDLIIFDLSLPSTSGCEFCTALRGSRITRDVPIIVLSASEEPKAMVEVLDAGADGFLKKPFFALELRAMIRGMVWSSRRRALARERDLFLWIIERSLGPVLVVGNQGQVIHANAEANKVFGLENGSALDVSAVIGRHFHTEPADAWSASRSEQSKTGDAFLIYRSETDQVPAQWFKVEVHAFDEGASKMVYQFTDWTQTVKRDLEIFTFQNLIAHKIRTPLTGIAPVLSVLEESEFVGADENARMLLKMARLSAERLQDTLLGILQYQEALFAPPVSGFFNETHTFSNLIAAASQAAGMGARVSISGPDGRVSHGEKLEFVLTELFKNYRKFSAGCTSGVEVNVLVRASGQWAISLTAPGAKLPPQVIAELGQPYRQLERNLCGALPGMGLGLATSRLLLRSIGGDLEFANSHAGDGLLTTVVLPAAAVQLSGGPVPLPQ
jgi:DNA-binding response OmpR family regulator